MPDREYFNNRRRNRRKELIKLKGGKCENCGSKKDLQFDHKSPKKKEFHISDRLDAPMDILLLEVDKCNLLCRKCHQEKTNKNKEHGQPKARHGTLHMYKKYKCRCKKCKNAVSEYNKNKRANIILNMSMMFHKISSLSDDEKNRLYRTYFDKAVRDKLDTELDKPIEVQTTIEPFTQEEITQVYLADMDEFRSKSDAREFLEDAWPYLADSFKTAVYGGMEGEEALNWAVHHTWNVKWPEMAIEPLIRRLKNNMDLLTLEAKADMDAEEHVSESWEDELL